MNSRKLFLALILFMQQAAWGTMLFDGTDDFVVVPNNATLKPPMPLSISFWVKPNSLAGHRGVISSDSGGPVYNGYRVWLAITTGIVGCAIGNGVSLFSTGRAEKNGTTGLPVGTWAHVVCVIRDYDDMSIYINGQDDGGTYGGTATTMVYAARDSHIGTMYNSAFQYMNGFIDDLRVYSRALTEPEIRSLALSRSRILVNPDNCTTLRAWWKLDEGTSGAVAGGATVKDYSGCNNTGTPSGGPIWRASEVINYP